ncbi:MAG: hypothetical protein ACE5FD_08390 [Anaerolineae bacterium]
MNEFQFTDLAADEKIIFGPITRTKTTSVSATGSGQRIGPPQPQQASLSRSSGQTIGVTNRRVIVEDLQSGDKTRIIANDAVSRATIRRKTKNNQTTLTLMRVQTANGQTQKLDLAGIPGHQEALLQETFPNAEISAEKGFLGSKGCWIILVILLFLACGVPVIGFIVGNLLN